MELQEQLRKISPADGYYMEMAKERWRTVAKPLHSLGKLEDAVIRMAGMKSRVDFGIDKKALVIMCADNGVVAEGVTQTGQEVTAIVAENFTRGAASVCMMAQVAGADLFPVDIGIASDVPGLTRAEYKIARGTGNMARDPAMTREQAARAVLTGIRIVEELADKGYDLIATGEMGIGNTTTSSALASVLLGCDPETVTGRGAGLSTEGLTSKENSGDPAGCKSEPAGSGGPSGCAGKGRRPGHCRSGRSILRRGHLPDSCGNRRLYLVCGGSLRGPSGAGCVRLHAALPPFGRTCRRTGAGSPGAFAFS